MNRTDELFIVGTHISLPASENSKTAFVELNNNGTKSTFSTDVLNVPDMQDTPWEEDNSQNATTTRAATNADLDGDGLEETVIVY
jgi:hypothetical protein